MQERIFVILFFDPVLCWILITKSTFLHHVGLENTLLHWVGLKRDVWKKHTLKLRKYARERL